MRENLWWFFWFDPGFLWFILSRYLSIEVRLVVHITQVQCTSIIILELKFYLTWVALILSFSFHLCGGVILLLLPYFIDFRAESLPNSTKLCIKDPRLVQIFLIDIYKVDIYLIYLHRCVLEIAHVCSLKRP